MTPDELAQKLSQASIQLNSAGYDAWGFHPETALKTLSYLQKLYFDYFQVHCIGAENVPQNRCLIVSNHGGQIPLDGLLLGMSLFFEPNPPRIARGMVEHFVPNLPFISAFLNRCGQVTGDPRNCVDLLENENAVMVFPEGVRGISKSIFKKYQLQNFGSGFLRIALQTRSPIIPTSILGTEEIFPGIGNLKPIAKVLKLPHFPMTPFFPWLGLLGAIPLPIKVYIHFGEPIYFDEDPDCSEQKIQIMIQKVKSSIQKGLRENKKIRSEKGFFGLWKTTKD